MKPYIWILLFFLAFGHSYASYSQNKPQHLRLKIIQTTDVHGAIFPYDFIKDEQTKYSLASVSTFVQIERAKKDEHTILLDNGDILQGQPVVYYSNFIDTSKTHVCAAVMNYMKYDAASVGNHDIETGHAVYDKVNKEFEFPWLAANAIKDRTETPYFKPYTIIEKEGIRIAVLGLITPAIPNWLPENIWSGMHFADMIESAKKWVGILKEKEKADLIIGLFHAGVDYTYNNQTEKTNLNENASKLVAELVPGFDVVFAGHDHREYNLIISGSDSSNILLLDPGSHAKKVAVAEIDLDWNIAKNKYDKEIKGKIVEMNNYQPDTVFVNKFEDYFINTKNYVDRVIGQSKRTFNARESVFGNSAFVDFIHEVQFKLTKAQISLTSPLSYNFEIKKGAISVRDMFKLYRFENFLYTMNLSGKEIKDYLEYSADLWFNQMNTQEDHLLKYTIDEKGKMSFINPYYNYSSAAGIKYTVDVSKPNGQKINIISFENGQAFEMDKIYSVAINSYRGNGGGGHLTNGAGIPKAELDKRIINSTDKDLRFYIIKYIEEKQYIDPAKRNNWEVIPSNWWKIAKKKEYKLLFPEIK
ncbi:MAG: bifunctional metallophosphatase/5'-nucleotidase [Bacteroidales bacterium]|nr:bifunctional metallophosphatase/5'-nucleotidase [Bacteroidales bacterium]